MGKQSKRLSLFNTLEVLKKYTDEEHRLSQKEILDILERDYDMVVDRRTIKSNLMDLIDLGYEIESEEISRMVRNKSGEAEENTIMSSIYLNRDFTKAELRLLIDSLLFSKHLGHIISFEYNSFLLLFLLFISTYIIIFFFFSLFDV